MELDIELKIEKISKFNEILDEIESQLGIYYFDLLHNYYNEMLDISKYISMVIKGIKYYKIKCYSGSYAFKVGNNRIYFYLY